MPPTEEEAIVAERDRLRAAYDSLSAEVMRLNEQTVKLFDGYRLDVHGQGLKIVRGERQLAKISSVGIIKLADDLAEDEQEALAPLMALLVRLERAMRVEGVLRATKTSLDAL